MDPLKNKLDNCTKIYLWHHKWCENLIAVFVSRLLLYPCVRVILVAAVRGRLKLLREGLVPSWSLQPGPEEWISPLSSAAVAQPLQGPQGGCVWDGLFSAAVVQSLDLCARSLAVRLHHSLHPPLTILVDETFSPTGSPVTRGLLLLTPFPVNSRYCSLWKSQQVDCFRDAAAGAPGTHYHAPLKLT